PIDPSPRSHLLRAQQSDFRQGSWRGEGGRPTNSFASSEGPGPEPKPIRGLKDSHAPSEGSVMTSRDNFEFAHAHRREVAWMSQNTNTLPVHPAILEPTRKSAAEQESTPNRGRDVTGGSAAGSRPAPRRGAPAASL